MINFNDFKKPGKRKRRSANESRKMAKLEDPESDEGLKINDEDHDPEKEVHDPGSDLKEVDPDHDPKEVHPDHDPKEEEAHPGSDPKEEADPGSDPEVVPDLKKNMVTREFYDKEIGYALRNNKKEQFYATDEKGDETYFVDENGDKHYCFKHTGEGTNLIKIQFPAKMKDGRDKYIYVYGKPKYCLRLDTNWVIFPKDPKTGKEIYIPDEKGVIAYPADADGNEFYRRNRLGDDILIPDRGYAEMKDGTQRYPRNSERNEFYWVQGDKDVVAIKWQDDRFVKYYAQLENEDEFYPLEYLRHRLLMDEDSEFGDLS